jgi:choline-sulfatase
MLNGILGEAEHGMPRKGMNILIVMADQLTPFAVGAYGGQAITPNIDRLAAGGIRFDSAYTNSPLCTPARYCFMTGRLISNTGAWDNAAYMSSLTPTFAHYLRLMGYRTSLSGKMHFVGPDQLHGFEERLTTDVYPADFGWSPDWTKPDERIDLWYHNMSSITQSGPTAVTNQLDYDDEVGALSMRWLYDTARNADDRPFCHVASFIHPHDPYAARYDDWELYEGREIDLPRTPRPAREDNDPHSLRLEKVIALDAVRFGDDDIRRTRRAYYANVTYVDRWLGKLMTALDHIGQRDNTAILFLSDHGDMLGERGLWYKMSPFEHSSRIPMILDMPGEQGGRVVSTAVSQVDVLPTLMEIASGGSDAVLPEIIDPLDGSSLAGSIDSDRKVAVEYCGEGSIAPILMLRQDKWKYVCCPSDPEMLFDLESDPDERTNLAATGEPKEVLDRFRKLATGHWDVDDVRARVLDSQRRRKLLTVALETGKRAHWDYHPQRDMTNEFSRSHLELSDFDSRMRWPRPPAFEPDWK